jgi:predicted DNA binding protein/DNA-binding response OmpR family regulator
MSSPGESSNSAGVRSARPVVLVVDDDEDLADTCEYWLRDDYEVRVAYSGTAALEEVDDAVDVVLLDRRMPTLSGDEVLAELDERGFDCRVAMMTAVEPNTDIVEMPFDEYLVKPVSKTEVRETVEELVVRSGFDESVQRFFALESVEEALEERDADELRDPEALETLRERVESVRVDHEAEIARRQRQLDHLHHVNDLLRDVDRAIVEATTREEIEETVCTSLVRTETYRAAWVAGYTNSSRMVTCRAAAGLTDPTVTGQTDSIESAISDALADGSVQTIDAIDDDHDGAVFTDAERERSMPLSAVVIPLTYRETNYGALFVYTDAGAEFLDRDIDVFEQLGQSIGNGINAVESKRLLYSDTVVELEFRHLDDGDIFVDLTRRFGGTLSLNGFAPGSESTVSCYVTATGVDGKAVFEAVTRHDAVERARIITNEGDETLFEWVVSGSTVLVPLVDFGADVESLSVTDGDGHVVVTVSPDADLRALTDAVQSSFPDVSVVAKRELERPVQSTETFRRELETKLTERQRDVVEMAFASGYFEWPRGSNAEEVAESLDISAPTFHEHLRASERKLVETFLDQTVGEVERGKMRSDAEVD